MKILHTPRKITPHPHRVTGFYASRKNGSYIGWESQLEKDVCFLLERNTDVVRYESQSRTFEYIDNGKKRTYTPDFFVKYSNGREMYLEVKPQKFVDKFKQNKQQILEEINKENISFKIITEIDIRCGYFLENIKFLERYADIPVKQDTLDIIAQIKNKYISIEKLAELVPLHKIYNLIYFDYFDIDINNQLIKSTSILGLYND